MPTADAQGDPLRDALERAIGFQYRIDRLLGRGGMGAVYLAHELALDRDVAIKVLPPEHADATHVRERFRREARTAARLNHPNIVPLYTFGEVDGLMYFVMGYVSGESLASRLQRDGAMDCDAARILLVDLADALAYAHRHGIVHRDLKPDNILIDGESGAPLLTDFGIAKAPAGDGQLTMAGQILGTAYYMSPEQALGRTDVDARSDLYSLGVVAYEIVSGRRPFDAENPMDALTQRLTQNPPPLRAAAPDAPEDVVAAIARCLEREPAHRWPDVKSFRAALAPAEDDAEDPMALRLLRMWAGLMVVALIVVGYVVAFGGRFADRAIGFFGGTIAAPALLMIGAMVVLKRQKLTTQQIVSLALRQPRWWRFWYPRRFRRPGDVWDRLPPRVRRLRMWFAAAFVVVNAGVMPTVLGRLFTGGHPNTALVVAVPVLMALLFVERSRTTKYVASTLGVSDIEASKILSTPSWRTRTWQNGPASRLLRSTTTRSSASAQPDTSVTTLRTPPVDRPDAVTRM